MALRATARGATSSLPSKERDDLQEELKQKAALLSSVQRNYEAISRLMQEKSNDMATMKLQLEWERATSASLAAKLEKALASQQRAEELVADVPMLTAQLLELQQQCERHKLDGSITQGKLDVANDCLTRLQSSVAEAEQRNRALRRDAEAKSRECIKIAADGKQVRSELAASISDKRALESEARALRDQLGRCDSRAAAAEQRADGLERRVEGLLQQVAASRDQIRELGSSMQVAKEARAAAEVQLDASRQKCNVVESQLRSTAKALQLSQEARSAVEDDSSQLKCQLDAAEEELRAAQTKYLLLDQQARVLEQQYNNAASNSLQTSDLLRDLQKRLEHTRRQLEDMRTSSQAAQKTHKLEEQRMTARIATLENRCTGLAAKLAHVGFSSAEAGGRSLECAEQLAGRLQQLGDRANDAIGTVQQMYEEALQAAMGQLLTWLTSCENMEGRLASLGPALATLEKVMEMARQAPAGPLTHEEEELRAEVVHLRTQLGVERQARANAAEEFGKQKAQWNDQVLQAATAAKRFAEETLTAERGRHAAHLGEVKSEVAHLRAAWYADKASAKNLLQMEQEKTQQAMAKMRQEAAAAAARAAATEKAALAELEETQGRTRRMLADMDKRLGGEAAVRQRVEAELGIARSNLEVAYNVGKAMLEDQFAVSKHMAFMGVPIPLDAAGAGGLPDVEDGTGSPSVRLCTAARLQFSYITEAVQNLLRDLPRQKSIAALLS